MSNPSEPTSNEPHGFDAGTYGRSFADVYDQWYPTDDDSVAAAALVSALAGDGGHVLELGVGTGRLALLLAERGCRVTGIDSSDEMLRVLRSKDPDGRVTALIGDLTDARSWPDAIVDVVLAANNLLCNLADTAAQRRTIELSAARLRPGGHLVVEAFVPAPIDDRSRALEVREVRHDGVTLIASAADADTGAVNGAHIELTDGAPVRVRPWRILPVWPVELDRWATDVGLMRTARHADWSRTPFDAEGARQVAVYRRPD
jgi:SAM-dependent methyltransferase